MDKTAIVSALLTGIGTAMLALGGCAPTSTGVLRIDPVTYRITVAEEIIEAKKIAYAEASQECVLQKKAVFMVSERKIPRRYSVYEFTFKCLDENDPARQHQPDYPEEPAVDQPK